nr:MIT C-terminal domain-containing protein [Rhizobium leguminosarum]
MSYFTASGEEIVVFCPESKGAIATQQPARRGLIGEEGESLPAPEITPLHTVSGDPVIPLKPVLDAALAGDEASRAEPREQHFTILYGDVGHSYETIIGPYLTGAKEVTIEDPYIRLD